MGNVLTTFQAGQVLTLFPTGSTILAASYFPSDYLPCPIKVVVQLTNQSQKNVVARVVRHRDASLAREAELLPILRNAGLPVPEVLLEPQRDPGSPDGEEFAVYSYLQGTTCQVIAEESPEGSKTAIQLVVSAATTLASLTPVVQSSAKQNLLPEITLLHELGSLQVAENFWLGDARVMRAIEWLHPKLSKERSPLIFSNGDYQPANFLSDGKKVTGFVDFEYACYQDFLYGFVKYPIYDMRPLNKAGIISYLLEKTGVPPTSFALRLALGCLKTLKREIPANERESDYCQHLFRLLENSMQMVGN